MQFTEIYYAVFLTVVFLVYWIALNRKVGLQNILLLAASYVFYGWWDWRFLILIIATTLTTYVSGLLARSRYGYAITAANIIVNLGILVAFKYLGFFVENLQRLVALFGWNLDWFTVSVLVPVGISFYTFQAIAYSVDVYKQRTEPCRNLLTFATFIAYFPQLVAGPIERSNQLLPQLASPRVWNRVRASEGLRMILFGVLKKVAVADPLSIYVERLFNGGDLSNPLLSVAAGILFTLEIYCDFSAYSEIAKGSSRLLGINLMTNFRFPLFSRNIVEYWRRWHISLMNWFRDYLYIPLGGSRKGKFRTYLNISIVFVLSGLWHGAAWNFVLWGVYWAIINMAGRALFGIKATEGRISVSQLPRIAVTFMFVAFGLYIFRCDNFGQLVAGLANVPAYIVVTLFLWLAAKMVSAVVTRFGSALRIALPVAVCAAFVAVTIFNLHLALKCYFLIPLLFVFAIEWRDRNTDLPFSTQPRNRLMRWCGYWLCMLFVLLSEPIDMQFIYFQF